MHSLRICRLALSFSALLCTLVSAQNKRPFTSPLPTGVRLDPAGDVIDLGSLPINLVLTPEKDKAVVVLSGWREQGVQVVDLKTRKVTQTLLQNGAFYGAAFSPDGHPTVLAHCERMMSSRSDLLTYSAQALSIMIIAVVSGSNAS
jgi:DNA-binding beta-propeller fold protein YncE